MKLTSKIKNYVKGNKKRTLIGIVGIPLFIFLTFAGAYISTQHKKKLLSELEKPVMNEHVQKLHNSKIKFNTEVSRIYDLPKRQYQNNDSNLFSDLEASVSSLKDQHSNEKNLNDLADFRRDLENYNLKVSNIIDIHYSDLYMAIPMVGGILSTLTAVGCFKNR